MVIKKPEGNMTAPVTRPKNRDQDIRLKDQPAVTKAREFPKGHQGAIKARSRRKNLPVDTKDRLLPENRQKVTRVQVHRKNRRAVPRVPVQPVNLREVTRVQVHQKNLQAILKVQVRPRNPREITRVPDHQRRAAVRKARSPGQNRRAVNRPPETAPPGMRLRAEEKGGKSIF
jgi:hypothetical protein